MAVGNRNSYGGRVVGAEVGGYSRVLGREDVDERTLQGPPFSRIWGEVGKRIT